MMFFSKFFKKDYGQLKQKGDSLFGGEHFAEARLTYCDALEKVETAADPEAERSYLAGRLAETGNRLAELNIAEAEAAIRSGDVKKGHDHLALALELADDVTIREKAEKLLTSQPAESLPKPHEHKAGGAHGAHGCASCSSSHGGGGAEITPDLPDHMRSDEQFHLLIHTLPGNLPQRYAALGEKFATAYLLAHSDELQSALVLYRELLAEGENDILLCEIALLEYRLGMGNRCESLLRKALSLDPGNPLVHLGLAQYFIDTRRYADCVPVLQGMLDGDILHDQALLMLGDVYAMMGNAEASIDTYTRGLQLPALKKVSAERLVQVLTAQNRTEEAAYLFKTYLKGCC
jgi:tetratricopeptide (TPR) repeat protein